MTLDSNSFKPSISKTSNRDVRFTFTYLQMCDGNCCIQRRQYLLEPLDDPTHTDVVPNCNEKQVSCSENILRLIDLLLWTHGPVPSFNFYWASAGGLPHWQTLEDIFLNLRIHDVKWRWGTILYPDKDADSTCWRYSDFDKMWPLCKLTLCYSLFQSNFDFASSVHETFSRKHSKLLNRSLEFNYCFGTYAWQSHGQRYLPIPVISTSLQLWNVDWGFYIRNNLC